MDKGLAFTISFCDAGKHRYATLTCINENKHYKIIQPLDDRIVIQVMDKGKARNQSREILRK